MTLPPIAVPAEVASELALGEKAVVAIGVSGGKDSCAVAIATHAYLRSINFKGTIVLIHSDLGATEWRQSPVKCRELAELLKVELIVVRRPAGGMLERWEDRWENNVDRYCKLECVKLILPWSTPSMRFCTSELKTAPICGALKKVYPGRVILNVVGIRREESTNRAKAPVFKTNPKLQHKTISATTGVATRGYDWHPIIEWKKEDVFACMAQAGFEPHEAYTVYGMTRVSCAFCILSNAGDLINAAKAEQNADLYRRMVTLESRSAFSFQSNKWLADVAPQLLSPEARQQAERAKEVARLRDLHEATIPRDLLYTKGWPHKLPTHYEARILAYVRKQISQLYSIPVQYTTAQSVIDRYAELLALKDQKDGKPARLVDIDDDGGTD